MVFNPLTGRDEDENQFNPNPQSIGPAVDLTNINAPETSITPNPIPNPTFEAPKTTIPTASVPNTTKPVGANLVETSGDYTNTSTQKTLTKEEVKAREEQQSLFSEQAANQKKIDDIQALKAIEEESRLLEKKTATDETVRLGQEDLKARLAERDAQYEKLKGMDFKDFWQDKSTSTKVLAGLAVAMGAFGQAMTKGSSNQALDIVMKNIEMDFAKQKAQVAKQEDVVNLAEKGIGLSREMKNDQLTDLTVKEAAAKDAVAAKYEQMLRQKGMDDNSIASDANLIKIKQSANDAKLKVLEDLRTTNTVQTQKKLMTQDMYDLSKQLEQAKVTKELQPTEAAGKAASYAKRMIAAVKDYDKVGGISDNGSQVIQDWIRKNATIDKVSGLPIVPAFGQMFKDLGPQLSQKDRRAYQAASEIITSTLRKDSGAAISLPEWEREYGNLFPNVGDDINTRNQKRKTITTRASAMIQEAGPLGQRAIKMTEADVPETKLLPPMVLSPSTMKAVTSDKAQGIAPAPEGQRVEQNGKTYEWNGSTYEEVK